MTIEGALSELNNLLSADDIPIYYKPGIKKVIETIKMEQEPCEDCINRGEDHIEEEERSTVLIFL